MIGLDRDKAAESAPEHEDWRNPQNAADRIERDAEPAHALAAERQNVVLVGVRRQISVGEAERAERGKHPAVRAVFAHARPDVPFGEQRGDAKRNRDRRQGNQRRMRKEPARAAGPRDGKAEKDCEADSREQREPRDGQSVLRVSGRSANFTMAARDGACNSSRAGRFVRALPAGRGRAGEGHAFRHRNRARGEAEADRGNRRRDRRSRDRRSILMAARSPSSIRSFLESLADRPDGKLILVTAINPTPAGEGKTTTTVGLGDALNRIGKKAIICLREPSLGPCFGLKGGAAGRRLRPGRADGRDQSAFHRRLPRHHVGAQSARRDGRQSHLLGQRARPRSAPHRLAPRARHERSGAARDSRSGSAAPSTAFRARTASTSPSPPR